MLNVPLDIFPSSVDPTIEIFVIGIFLIMLIAYIRSRGGKKLPSPKIVGARERPPEYLLDDLALSGRPSQNAGQYPYPQSQYPMGMDMRYPQYPMPQQPYPVQPIQQPQQQQVSPQSNVQQVDPPQQFSYQPVAPLDAVEIKRLVDEQKRWISRASQFRETGQKYLETAKYIEGVFGPLNGDSKFPEIVAPPQAEVPIQAKSVVPETLRPIESKSDSKLNLIKRPNGEKTEHLSVETEAL